MPSVSIETNSQTFPGKVESLESSKLLKVAIPKDIPIDIHCYPIHGPFGVILTEHSLSCSLVFTRHLLVK